MNDVEPRHAPLALEPEQFRALGHALVDQIAELLESMPARRVRPDTTSAELNALLPAGSLPATGEDAGALLGATTRLLFEHSTWNGHPRFFGYITSSPAHIGMLGDLLAAAVNPNCGSWTLGPMATEIETQTIRWIAELIGYPPDAGGVLVSGGNVANFTCFLAARARVLGADVRRTGLAAGDARGLVVYTSAETHTWIQKATDLFGLGTDAIRWIPCDDRQRMDVTALRAAMDRDAARGLRALLVVGTAGSVSTGAVDPLHEIADVCRERGVWFHVDGAYGGFAAAVPGAAPGLDAISRADSVAVDPHKWLYAPLEAGCSLVRDVSALHDAFSYHPEYYHFDDGVTNYVDRGMQNSRGFRALKVWLGLRQAGRDGYVRMIADDINLARRLHERVAAHPDLEAGTCALSICTFRYVPAQLQGSIGDVAVERHLDELNRILLDRLQKGGDVFVSNAVVAGRYLLRACIVNFNTRISDVDALPDIVAGLGAGIHAELSADAGGTQLDV
jgi:aromatic-L-amino-acid/L-tryptophan decarboxylase